ncbi:MAG: class I SAM-dependent methyltransferase [Streptosporangiaceae bacterium]
MRAADHTAPEELPLNGERTLPGIWHENYWFRRHEIAYAAIVPHVRGAKVLDVGCGEGYGSAMLADHAAQVIALDYDPLTVAHAHRQYPSLAVVSGNAVTLPVTDGSVDAVVALQVVEHLWDQQAFVRECARVLRPGGRAWLSTPNRLTFSPGRDTPRNPCHTRELAPDELAVLLAARFAVERLLGVHHGRRLTAWERNHGAIVDAQLGAEPGTWPAAVRDTVAGIRADDFELRDDDPALSLDVLAVATRQ